MQVRRLDHVNIQTTQLNKMVAWYEEILGLRPARARSFHSRALGSTRT